MISRKVKQRVRTRQFSIVRGVLEIEKLTEQLPLDGESFRYITNGGFSSISFVRFISRQTKIREFTVSTLRVGKKELRELHLMKIPKVNFIVGSLMKQDNQTNKRYGYFDNLEKLVEKNNWTISVLNNHSKVLLFDTEIGKFVIETSSNMNENPKIEQFHFEKSDEVYSFYYEYLKNEVGGEFGKEKEV